MNAKRSAAKSSGKKTHAVIGSFGAGAVLWGEGLGVRVEMFPADIARLVEVVGEHFAESGDEAGAKAAEALAKKLRRPSTKLRVSTEVVIAAHGAALEPILKVSGEKTTWETPSGRAVPARRGHGFAWE